MKRTIMKCDCCGKEFYTEYWTGGYIDHVTNFSENFHYYAKCTLSDTGRIKQIEDEILKNGNAIREKSDAECRLNCFLCAEVVPKEVRDKVERDVRPQIGVKEEIMKRFIDCIKEPITKEFTKEELQYIYRVMEENPYGTCGSPLVHKIEYMIEGMAWQE